MHKANFGSQFAASLEPPAASLQKQQISATFEGAELPCLVFGYCRRAAPATHVGTLVVASNGNTLFWIKPGTWTCRQIPAPCWKLWEMSVASTLVIPANMLCPRWFACPGNQTWSSLSKTDRGSPGISPRVSCTCSVEEHAVHERRA